MLTNKSVDKSKKTSQEKEIYKAKKLTINNWLI